MATKVDETRFLPPGKLVDLGGYSLHISCIGEGDQTVVLEAGHAGNSLEWALVQSEVSKFTRVCSYDRAGYGWSEESPYPRTSDQVVLELHELLTKAQIPKPYILVGHSLGGVNVRLYAHQYPDEVSGIILVDSSHEDQEARLPPEPKKNFFIKHPKIAEFFTFIGIHRLMMQASSVSSKLRLSSYPDWVQKAYLAKLSSTKCMRTAGKESSAFVESLIQLKNVQFSFRDKPLIVLTAGKCISGKGYGFDQEWLNQAYKVWKDLQKELVAQSTKGKQIIAEHSDHQITRHQPSIIIEAIKELINSKEKFESTGDDFQKSKIVNLK
ncbi:alpha/beta hydrolase [Candidatus Rhabdochlamydia porcellionis]|uniref:alpha/beta hydrolase n=1 Tax=Candidatus Rhabdochlamydia porcellionis TaxID=225148 RepID=UPI001890C926|nr:alpha/beta hydrolase [Candidatus Rhabdochlamydia porcellionis]